MHIRFRCYLPPRFEARRDDHADHVPEIRMRATAWESVAGAGKRRSTEQRNTVTMGVTATADSTSEWREVGAQVTDTCPTSSPGDFGVEATSASSMVLKQQPDKALRRVFNGGTAISDDLASDRKTIHSIDRDLLQNIGHPSDRCGG